VASERFDGEGSRVGDVKFAMRVVRFGEADNRK